MLYVEDWLNSWVAFILSSSSFETELIVLVRFPDMVVLSQLSFAVRVAETVLMTLVSALERLGIVVRLIVSIVPLRKLIAACWEPTSSFAISAEMLSGFATRTVFPVSSAALKAERSTLFIFTS